MAGEPASGPILAGLVCDTRLAVNAEMGHPDRATAERAVDASPGQGSLANPRDLRGAGEMHALQAAVFAIGAAVGIIFPFLPAILLERGFDANAVGLLLAIMSVGTIVSIPVWGHLADVVLGRPRALEVAALGAALATGLLVVPLPAILIAIGLVTWNLLASAFPGLGDAIAVNTLARIGGEYGRVRLLSSIGFALAATAGGLLYDRAGYDLAFVLFVAISVCLAVTATRLKDVPRADLESYRLTEPQAVAEPGGGRFWWSRERWGSIPVALRRAPTLAGLLLAVGLSGLGLASASTFLPVRLVELGAPPSIIAYSVSISALCEIPVMLFGRRLAARLGLRVLFICGCLFYAVAFASWAVTDSTALILIGRAATGIAFAAVAVSSVLAVGAMLPAELQATGQALRQMAWTGVAAIAGNAVGGVIYGAFGPAALFVATALACAAAVPVAWRSFPGRARTPLTAGHAVPRASA